MESEWMNSAEVAALLGCLKKQVCKLARQGWLKGEMAPKSGGHWVRRVHTTPITASDQDIIWFAGFFDGEGCVTIQRRIQLGGGWHLSVIMPNSACQLMYTLPSLFGGSCHEQKLQSHQNLRQVRWRASGRQAGIILKVLLPYLRVKHRQAALGIEFQERIDRGNNNGHRPVSAEEAAWRDEVCERMKWLNHHYE
jgi:hypothetical protein